MNNDFTAAVLCIIAGLFVATFMFPEAGMIGVVLELGGILVCVRAARRWRGEKKAFWFYILIGLAVIAGIALCV